MENSHTMNSRSRTRISTLLASVLWALPFIAGAQGPLGRDVVQGYAAPARNLPQTILQILNFLLILVGIFALAFLVYGGFRYITSRGEDDEVEAAKSIITNAVIGIVVIGISAAVVNFVIDAVIFGAAR